MPLPDPHPDRRLEHRRTLEVQVHSRPDRLWEVEAVLTDVKTRDAPMSHGVREAGTPIHQLRLRLVINAGLDIIRAGSQSEWTPYPAHCPEHGDAYAALEGLNLARGFRRAVAERLGGTRGCTHLTELAQVLPTAVIQGMVGQTIDPRGTTSTEQPFQLDRCHALRTDGEVVRLHYPRWHRQPRAKLAADNAASAPGVAGTE
jgi:hypothetical protein